MLLRRTLIALFTIFVALTLTFFLVRNMPGDIIYAMAMDKANAEGIPFDVAYEQVAAMYGLAIGGPIHVQYFNYVKELFTGNLGKSIHTKLPATTIIVRALPWTAFVCSISLLLSFVLGNLIGMAAAWKRRTLLDPIVSGYASITDATPDYITAVILLIIFAINLKWFPVRGAYTAGLIPGFNARFILDVLHHAFLPIMAYTIENIGGWTLIMKSNAISVLGEDYIKAARARGLRDRRIAVSYVGRNAILPPFTGLAIAFGGMLGGSALIENVFAYPGMGFFFGQATSTRDYPLMQGLFLLTIGGVIMANLLADFLYSRLDPRVRIGGK